MGLFPMGHEREPREEMEDTLCEMLCSVIPIQPNKNQTQPGHRAQPHLEPSTAQSQPQTQFSCVETLLSTLILDFVKQQTIIGR